MLCTTCTSILAQPLSLVKADLWLDRWSASFEYTITFTDLEAKAAKCYGCNGILRQAIKTHLVPQANDVLQIAATLAIQTSDKGSVQLWNKVLMGGKSLGVQVIHFEQAPEKGKTS